MKHKIGIIIPVYRAENFIKQCIESILSQTYTDFRLILVDDGSPDNCGEICDIYSQKDKRITVVHQENSGATKAREKGVATAEDCEFITFADADDIMPPTALEMLATKMTPQTGIVVGKLKRFHDNLPSSEDCGHGETERISYEEFRRLMLLGIDSGPYCKLIRRTLFTPSVFDIPREIIMGEDTIANTRIAFNNKQEVTTTTACVYYYRQHESSIMRTFVHTAIYEEMFVEHLWRSIPEKEKENYMHTYIQRRIDTFDSFFGYSAKAPEWQDSKFLQDLMTDIKKYKYNRHFIERLLLTEPNEHRRKILIFLKRIKNYIARRLKSIN